MIDVNKFYKTKDGLSVIIGGIGDDCTYPIYGAILDLEGNHSRTCWTLEGHYFCGMLDGRDLIEDINETNEKI